MKTGTQIREKMEELRGYRQQWETRWQSISDHQLARQDFVNVSRHNAPRDAKIYDGTAMDAWNMLTNALQSILANVETNWIYLEVEGVDESELTDEEVFWLELARLLLLETFRNAEGRFAVQFNETLGDYTGYGTAAIASMYDPSIRGMKFSSRPLGEIFVDQDDQGIIDCVYREFKLTMRQSLLAFPNMPDSVHDVLKRRNEDAEFCWIQTFEPHDEISNKIQSQVALSDGNTQSSETVREETLDELPLHVGRWRTDPGQRYGTGPGVNADAFARTLNSVVKDWITQSQMSVRPPLLVADDGVIGIPSTLPGTTTKISAYTPGSQDPVRPMDVGGNFRVAEAEIARLQSSIRRAYLHDILQITDDKELTAFHVQELTNRSQQWVAPVFQRAKVELIQPMVNRALNQMMKMGAIPKPPSSLTEKGFRVVYVSPAQRAQEIEQVELTMKSIERIMAIGQGVPEVLDNIDFDYVVREGHRGFAADPKALKTRRTVAQARQQRAQQQAAQEAQNQALTMGAGAAAMDGDAQIAKVLGDLRR